MDKFDYYCEKYGFVPDNDKVELKHILNHGGLKTLHIETYTLNPYMLLLRSVERNVSTTIRDGRIIIRKMDKHKTSIVDINFDGIFDCIVKKHSDLQYEIVFLIHNIYYKLLIII